MNNDTPEEKLLIEAFDKHGIKYERGKLDLDFYLPDYGFYIESKGSMPRHTTFQKVKNQLTRDPNIILIQGYECTLSFIRLLERNTPDAGYLCNQCGMMAMVSEPAPEMLEKMKALRRKV